MERLTEPMIVPSTGEIFCYRLKPGVSEWKLKNKLGAYETEEEHGLLLRLPCKVGDEVWEANGFWKKILKRTVAAIVLSSGNHIYIRNGCGDSFEFGVDVFLTKAEAEKALAEMG